MKRRFTFLLTALLLLTTGLYSWGQTRTIVTDTLNREMTGVTGTTYASWAGITSNSDAVYAGQSAGGNDAIQMRSNNSNSGIITTASGGMATSISITWNDNTAEGRQLDVYGKDSPYASPTELYNSQTQGTLLGTIVKGTSTELGIGNYPYIGLRSHSGVLYLDEIVITWSVGGTLPNYYSVAVAPNIANGTITVDKQRAAEGETVTVTANPASGYELSTLTYSYTGAAPVDIMETMQFTMPAADVIVDGSFDEATLEPMSIAEARSMSINEYAMVQGVVTFIDGRNVYIQDESAGIDLYLNNNTVPANLAIGDQVYAYGKLALFKGLVELSGINGDNANEFGILSSGNELPLEVKTIDEILADFNGENMLQSTRVQVVEAIIGSINYDNNTPITQDGSTLNIFKLPVIEDLAEDDIVTVTGIIGCYNNPQLRVATAEDVIFEHPNGISLVATPNTLTGLDYNVEEGGPSPIMGFALTANNLEGAVYVYPSEHFEISSGEGEYFIPENRITISGAASFNNIMVYVRLKAGLELGTYNESLYATTINANPVYINVSGSVTSYVPPVMNGYTRLTDVSQLTDGAQVIFAARFDGNANEYYAMTNTIANKIEGVLFTSVMAPTGGETLPSSITDEEALYTWTVNTDGTHYTFTNADGNVLGYNSGTNFTSGGDNTAWTIEFGTADPGAMVPQYQGFVVTNANSTGRAFALNATYHSYGAYSKSNMTGGNAEGYNFYLDMFAITSGGTMVCATPSFTPESGTFFEPIEVTINCATTGATIYYTLDGSNPTPNSAVYDEPITISETTAIKAIAVKEGYEDSGIAEAQYVIVEGSGTIFFQDWEGDMNGWTFVTVEGGKPWNISQYNGNHYAYANGYNGGANEQWCISPAFNLDAYSDVTLTFKNAKNFTGPDLQLFFSNDYDGANPSEATWTELSFNMSGGSYAWTESGTIELSGFAGDNCYIGFKYTSTENQAAAWEVDDVTLMGFTSSPMISVNPNTLSFTYTEGNGPSNEQSFTITGMNLTEVVTMTLESDVFEMSTESGDDFDPMVDIEIEPSDGAIGQVIYVRMAEGLSVGSYSGTILVTSELNDITLSLSGSVTTNEPPITGDYTRLTDVSQLTDGAQVIFAARFDGNANNYYAMTNHIANKIDGVLFTSVMAPTGGETLPSSITDEETLYYWTVSTDGTHYTFTNAEGNVLGYNSGTNFTSGGDNTAWTIEFGTADPGAMVPEYQGFVVTNTNNTGRAFALNATYHSYGAYSKSNMTGGNAEGYNFYLDMFAITSGGTMVCATPSFTPEGGTFYEPVEVTINCATAGATIYYTLDGSDPTPNSAVYDEPITISETTTIKAIAVKEGYEDSGIAEAQYAIVLGAVTIFNQDWEGDMNGWTFVTVEGSKPWNISQYNGNHYAYANGYNGGANEQWCISPAFNLDAYSDVTLTFRNAMNFNGPDLQLFFSNDYDGTDPTEATWEELDFNMSSGSYAWVESGTIELSGFAGDNCYIGFKYTSTENQAAAWEVDDVNMMGFTSSSMVVVTPNALSFSYMEGNGPSNEQSFTLTGMNLTDSVTITLESDAFEMSTESGDDFDPMVDIEIEPSAGTIGQVVYVRMAEGLSVGSYSGTILVTSELDDITMSLSGTVSASGQGGEWNRIYSLADLTDGSQVIIASRYDATVGDGYYAMTAEVSGKPDGVLFTSVINNGVETLPDEIVADAETFLWNVTVNDDIITLTNANGDALGYGSSTNFAGNTSTDWSVAYATSGENAMVPNYTGFLITNVETNNRCIVMNANHKFGAYHTNNINNGDYNFYLDLFLQGGTASQTVATPVFSVASGTYYEEFDVEITCATEGAVIYYTTDGSNPTAESMVYEEAIHVDGDVTLKAIAMMEGYENSSIATVNYVVITGQGIILSQDWEGDMNGWTFVTVEGNKPWNIGTYGGNKYAYANGYNDNIDNEQWCISPAFDLTYYREVVLTFRNAMKFTGPDMQLFFSSNYDGEHPSAATWTELDYVKSEGNYTWTESGEISLDGLRSNNCYIAFLYTSNLEDGAAAWEIDDILILGTAYDAVDETEITDVNFWNYGNEIFVDNQTNGNVQMTVFNMLGQQVYSKTLGTGSIRFSHNLSAGLYVVTLQNSKESMSIKMMVR